jgi:hypothetical protein
MPYPTVSQHSKKIFLERVILFHRRKNYYFNMFYSLSQQYKSLSGEITAY